MSWGLLLDSGAIIHERYTRRQARVVLARYNQLRAAQIAAGDMVKLRRAIGIVERKPKPLQRFEKPVRARAGGRRKRA
jgi:hypothetical protein